MRDRHTAGRFHLWLGLVVVLALALRVIYVLAAQDVRIANDGWFYSYGATLLADGRGFVNPIGGASPQAPPSALHPPAWLVALTGPSLVGLRAALEHQLFACLVGSATIIVVGLAGRRLAGPRVGVAAAAIAALYPNFWMYERELQAETLVLLGSAVAILLAYRFRDDRRLGWAAALGGVCGLLALTRAELVLLVPLLLGPLVLLARDVERRRRLGWLALACGTAAAVIAPWTAYNLTRFDNPVFLSTGLGEAMLVGSCRYTYSGEYLGFWDRRCSPLGTRAAGDDDSTDDLEKRRRALDYARDHVRRLPLTLLAREGRTWGFFRPFQEVRLDTRGRYTSPWVIGLGLIAYWLLAAATVAGAVILHRQSVPVWPLLVFVMIVAITVAITFGQTRYRAPAEVPIVLLAAVAFDALVSRLAPARDGGSDHHAERTP